LTGTTRGLGMRSQAGLSAVYAPIGRVGDRHTPKHFRHVSQEGI